MDIVATNTEHFGGLEASTMGKLQRIRPKLIREGLDAVDEAPFAKISNGFEGLSLGSGKLSDKPISSLPK
jgi:hypothetical protein